MPKNVLRNPFGRRSSSGNVLDSQPEDAAAPATSSFRVLERPNKNVPHSLDGADRRQQNRLSQARPFNSPLQALRGKSADDLVGLGGNRSVDETANSKRSSRLIRLRGSGGTTTSGSSGYYESSAASARYSSTSTLPSSLDQERDPEGDELFPRKTATPSMYQSFGANHDELPPPPSFSSRATRALSFGLKSKRPEPSKVPSLPTSPIQAPPPQSPGRSYSPSRERAMTTSSYASTAVPPKVDMKPDPGTSDFGNDLVSNFGGMFDDHARNRKAEEPLQPLPQIGAFHRTEFEPMFPPRSYSRQGLTPPPNQLRNLSNDPGSPYSWDSRNSRDGLVSASALSSPNTDGGPPPTPARGGGIAPALLGGSKQGYSLVPERYSSPGLEQRSSQDSQAPVMAEQDKFEGTEYRNRQPPLGDGNTWVKRYDLQDPQESSSSSNSHKTPASSSASASSSRLQPQAFPGATRLGAISPGGSTDEPLWATDSNHATPRAAKLQPRTTEGESMFDAPPSGPSSRAVRLINGHHRTESSTPKKMTKAQFEILQRYSAGDFETVEEDNHSGDDYDDDDDIERAKQAAKLRRKQEANMAVYRQQMMKSSGGGPADLPPPSKPGLDRNASSTPLTPGLGGLHLGGVDGRPPSDTVRGKPGDDDDEDVPLGILQAHGFPSANRPPTVDGAAPRQASVAGSMVNGGAGQGNLPPFARRLPADPYFGAGIVNNANRQSLAFGSSAAYVNGGASAQPQQPAGHPGGLVGVIAGEERARAARRGSPNPVTGGYGPVSLPTNMPSQMPMMPRAMSMGSVAQAPSMYTPSNAPPMPMMPQMTMMPQMPMDANAQQMQQFMQMQMQVMQNFMAMQQAQMSGQQAPQQAPQMPMKNFLSPPSAGHRPISMASQASSFAPNHGRAMTMIHPPSNWGSLQAPQQRPNTYMPSGYAPSVNGLNISSAGGPGPGYTPSIAPSERSNIGMPSRYRPVQNGEGSIRAQSMTSSMTLQAFQNQGLQGGMELPRPESRQQQQPKSTIRIIDKPKGAPKVTTKTVDADEDDDDNGWAEMAKKRHEKKFWRGRKENGGKNEVALSELYQEFN